MPPFRALAFSEKMAGVAHRTASLGTSGPGWATADALRSTGLTAVALAILALGLALLVLPGLNVAPGIPAVLIAVALGVLVVILLLSRGERPGRSPVESTNVPEAPRETYQRASSPSPAIPTDASRGPRAGVPGRGSAWRILSSPTEPGDETWLSWLPRESRRLGPEGGSVVRGVVPSPGRAGNLVAFPVRDYFGGALPPVARGPPSSVPATAREGAHFSDEHAPTLSSSRASPFSDEELDRMFPPEGRRDPILLEDAPDRIGGHSPWGGSGAVAHRSFAIPETTSERPGRGEETEAHDAIPLPAYRWNRRVSENSEAPSTTNPREGSTRTSVGRTGAHPSELREEASNPVPPHLRASGPLIRFEPRSPTRGGKGSSAPRSVCASCSKVVVDLRMSGPCPKCLRPLCHECLREALVTVGHGWCLDCSRATMAG